jgi:GNAT superfamily N-acetyltransferase
VNDLPPWTIRPYRPGDEAALAALFARVFNRPMSEDHWRWKLTRLAAGMPNVFLAVVPDDTGGDRPVFQCAAIPVRYRGPDGDVLGMVAVDAMTDPDFRRQGLMSLVSRHAYDCWRDAGAAFVIGLPNEQWGSRARALGWRELFPLSWRVRLLRPDRIVTRRLGRPLGLVAAAFSGPWKAFRRGGPPSDPTVRIRRAVAADAFDSLWPILERLRGSPTAYSIVRDRAWIEWRYLSAPDASYRIWVAEKLDSPIGYCVSRLVDRDGRDVGFVAELAAAGDDATVLRLLLDNAVADLDREGAELVAALAMPGTPADRALRRAGFLFSWGSFTVQMVPLRSATPSSFSEVHGGDFDVV